MAKIALREAKNLVSSWAKGTFSTVSESIKYHFARHGREVSAEDVWQYLRKSGAFARNLRGARTSELETGVTRFMKNGYYIIKDNAGKILSFGSEKNMKIEVEEKLKILQELYKSDFLHPFPHEDCRKILRRHDNRFELLVPCLDVYFSDVAGFCSRAKRISDWSFEENESATGKMRKSFFERFSQFSDLKPEITEKETPKLYNQLLIYDLMRLTLLDVLSEIRNEKHSEMTKTSQLSLVN